MYSFSKLNSFDEGCRWSWYQSYINRDRGESNQFAEYGTIIHDLSAKIIKDEIFVFEKNDIFTQQFKNMKYPLDPNFSKKYYDAGIRYLSNFDGFKGYNILEVEQKYIFDLDGVEFVAIPDLVMENDKLVLLDYKTSKEYKGQELGKKIRQLYLYGIAIHNKYGRWPDILRFEFTRFGITVEKQFKQSKLNETKEWVFKVINEIEKETEFKKSPNNFFCRKLCGHRNKCKYGISNIIN